MIFHALYITLSKTHDIRNHVRPQNCAILSITILSILLFLNTSIYAQTLNLSLKYANKPLSEIIDLLEKQTPYRFIYRSIDTQDQLININITNQPVEEILRLVFEQTDLSYTKLADNLIVLSKGSAPGGVASDYVVSGVVIDANGISIPGVNIREKNSFTGTVSDKFGRFTMLTKGNATLVFSIVGYHTTEVILNGKNSIRIVLEEQIGLLSEIVIIGYGVQKRTDLTGSIVSLNAEKIASAPITGIGEVLRGRVAGAEVTHSFTPGASPTIMIRGKNSITGSNAPLWVIDGIPIQGNNIDINPSDIASIDILKDASATAIFGSRGSNGVIILSSKKASATKPLYFTYDGYSGHQTVSNAIHMMNGNQYAEYRREAFRAIMTNLPSDQVLFDIVQLESIGLGRTTDWIGLVLDDSGWLSNHNFGINHKGDYSSSRITFGYYKNQSIIEKANYERYSVNLNSSINLSERFTVEASAISSHGVTNEVSDHIRHYMDLNPLGVPYDKNGLLQLYANPNEGLITNPLMEIRNNDIENKAIRFIGNLNATYKFSDVLRYSMVFGPDMRFSRHGQYYGSETRERSGGSPMASFESNYSFNYVFDHIINYKKVFNEYHTLDATAVFDLQKYRSEGIFLLGSDMDYDGLWYNLGAAATIIDKRTDLLEWGLLSYMGRINYIFNDKYLVTVTGRYDGSSRLSKKNKWAFFPSAAFAWKVNEESFFTSTAFDELKLRISWGQTGNSTVAAYETHGRLEKTLYDWDNKPAYGFVPSIIPNPDLKWERTEETNLGLDWSLFSNRIFGSLDIYNRTTKDLLLARNLPITSGFEIITQNIGSVNNKGIELMFGGHVISTINSKLKFELNYAKNQNKILDLYGDSKDDPGSRLFIGYPIDVRYVYEFIGVWQLNEAEEALAAGARPGWPKYRAARVDGVLSPSDRVVFSRVPKWVGGLSLSYSFKSVDLYAYIYTRQGVSDISEVHSSIQQLDGRYNSGLTDYWTPGNPTNSHPQPNANNYSNINTHTSYLIKDMSFVRLSNISVGYSFDQKKVSRLAMDKFRIYISIQNPFVWTKYDGWDPELGTRRDAHPPLRTILIGVNSSF